MSKWRVRVNLCWIFSNGPGYSFTEKRYSWISHANLASDEGQVRFLQVL